MDFTRLKANLSWLMNHENSNSTSDLNHKVGVFFSQLDQHLASLADLAGHDFIHVTVAKQYSAVAFDCTFRIQAEFWMLVLLAVSKLIVAISTGRHRPVVAVFTPKMMELDSYSDTPTPRTRRILAAHPSLVLWIGVEEGPR